MRPPGGAIIEGMDEFLKMDVFFLVTTIVVIVVGLLLTFVLFRVWKILGRVEHVAQEVESEAKLVRGDIAQIRTAGKFGFRKTLRFLTRLFIKFADDESKRGDL